MAEDTDIVSANHVRTVALVSDCELRIFLALAQRRWQILWVLGVLFLGFGLIVLLVYTVLLEIYPMLKP